MQNSTKKLSTRNYSSTKNSKKLKQRRSIFDVPEPVEPQRINRIKNRRNIVRNYRDKIRDIYHQTDFLVNWKDDDLSCFINPIEKTSKYAFLEKTTRNNFSTLSNDYMGSNSAYHYRDSTLPYETTETIHSSQNATDNESTNLVTIPTERFTNQLYNVHDENTDQGQYNLDDEKNQIDSALDENESQVQSEMSDKGSETQPQSGSNSREYEQQFYIDDENDKLSSNEEENVNSEQYDVSPNEDDQTIIQTTNFTEFSAINSNSQAKKDEESNNIELEEDLDVDVNPDNEEQATDSNINLSVTVVVFEEEEDLSFVPIEKESLIEAVFVRVENLPLNGDHYPLFVTCQHYTEDDDPIGIQSIIDLERKGPSVLNFSNVSETDIIEFLVFLNDDENDPTLVSGIRLPVKYVDWNCHDIQFFDLISADDLRAGISIPKGDAGRIALNFKLL